MNDPVPAVKPKNVFLNLHYTLLIFKIRLISYKLLQLLTIKEAKDLSLPKKKRTATIPHCFNSEGNNYKRHNDRLFYPLKKLGLLTVEGGQRTRADLHHQ